jgi:hypothetical protein
LAAPLSLRKEAASVVSPNARREYRAPPESKARSRNVRTPVAPCLWLGREYPQSQIKPASRLNQLQCTGCQLSVKIGFKSGRHGRRLVERRVPERSFQPSFQRSNEVGILNDIVVTKTAKLADGRLNQNVVGRRVDETISWD